MRVTKLRAAVAVVASLLAVGVVGTGVASAAHAVTSVTPGQLGQGAANVSIAINGSGFSNTLGNVSASVSGAGVTLSNVTLVSATKITATATVAVNAAVGARDVTVTQGLLGADTFTCAGCLVVGQRPSITSLNPTSGENTGPATVGAIGSGFQSGATMILRKSGQPDIPVTGISVNGAGTTISGTADLTGKLAGRWQVIITNPDLGSTTFGDGSTSGYLVAAATPVPAPGTSHDFTGDGCADVLAFTRSGTMFVYAGACNGHFANNGVAPPGNWSLAVQIVRADWNRDGCDDVLATDANGYLYLFFSDCNGGFYGNGALIGSSWDSFSTILSPGDFNGDGCSDLLGILPNGQLKLYRGDCGFGFIDGSGILIGSSWTSFAKVLAPGDFSGDGCNDLLGMLGDGKLLLYLGNCNGGFKNGVGILVGTSWDSFTSIITVGDFSGDSCPDVMGILWTGDLMLYKGNCASGFQNGVGILIGTDWGGFRFVM